MVMMVVVDSSRIMAHSNFSSAFVFKYCANCKSRFARYHKIRINVPAVKKIVKGYEMLYFSHCFHS